MSIPDNSNDLRAAGYVYDNEGVCRGCGEPIEWYITPRGKKMPFSRKTAGTATTGIHEILEPHFASCPQVKDFRR